MNPGTIATPTPPSSSPGLKIAEKGEDCIIERSYHKEFSHSILKHRIEEFRAGKYSQKYIETYLDFVHLEGIIDNLKYLEYKKQLVAQK